MVFYLKNICGTLFRQKQKKRVNIETLSCCAHSKPENQTRHKWQLLLLSVREQLQSRPPSKDVDRKSGASFITSLKAHHFLIAHPDSTAFPNSLHLFISIRYTLTDLYGIGHSDTCPILSNSSGIRHTFPINFFRLIFYIYFPLVLINYKMSKTDNRSIFQYFFLWLNCKRP